MPGNEKSLQMKKECTESKKAVVILFLIFFTASVTYSEKKRVSPFTIYNNYLYQLVENDEKEIWEMHVSKM